MEKEIWKDIPEYEGLYQVSNLGNVKSLNYKKTNKEKKLKLSNHHYGYKVVCMCKNNERKIFLVHQLVAMAFLNHKPCRYKLVIDHINDNPSDNRIENLQIVTHRFNVCKTQNKYQSKYKGVYLSEGKYWKSQIRINKQKKHIGLFKTEYEAHLAYQNALKNI